MEEKKRKKTASAVSGAAEDKKRVQTAGKKRAENTAGRETSPAGKKTVSTTKKKVSPSAAKQSTSARKRTASGRKEIDVPDIRRAPGTPIWAEIGLWVMLAICMVMLLNNFFGIGGVIGNAVSRFFFGLFGVMAHFIPFLLFFATAFLIANRGSAASWIKTVSGFVLLICLSAFCELLTSQFEASRSFADYYEVGSEMKAGGGIAGALLCKGFCPLVGVVGAWIFLVILTIIALVILTGHSMIDSINKNGKRAIGNARNGSAMRKELHELKKEKNQLQKRQRMQDEITKIREENEGLQLEFREPRRARTVSGVTDNTTLDKTLPVTQEIHEVTPKVRDTAQRRSRKPLSEREAERAKQTAVRGTAAYRSDPAGNVSENSAYGFEPTEDTFENDVYRTAGSGNTFENTAHSAVPAENNRSEDAYEAVQNRIISDPVVINTADHAPEDTFHTKAKRMVDSVSPKQSAKQLDLNFTIQRNGVAEQVIERSKADDTDGAKTQKASIWERVSIQDMPDIEELPRMPQMKDAPVMQEIRPAVHTEAAPNTGRAAHNLAGTAAELSEEKDASSVIRPEGNRTVKQPKSSKEEQEREMQNVAEEIAQSQAEAEKKPAYVYPPVDLLTKPKSKNGGNSTQEVKETAVKLQQTLHSFGVNVTVTNVSCGPAVTRYELTPEQGVKVSRIVNLSDDIKLNLAAADIRIEAPIPGKPAVGIEVPNKENSAVMLRELIESPEFQNAPSKLSFAVGKDISGKVVVADIARMPHLLIAGATGSGKSVCINTLIMSILYKADPEEVKLIMIDPKVVELSVYNGIPHLFIPVVTDPKKASGALNWGVAEMTDRYNKFAECGVRDLKGYNAKIEALADVNDPNKPKKLPQIIIIVDELADLMMVAPGEVEDAICRLAQLARAAGIHLIIATQRPSVNVITGLIKANMPSRIAFSVSSGVDSRTIIDMNGAEKLLGKGDMLFYPQGYQKPVRVQGAFVSDTEVSAVADFLRGQGDAAGYGEEMQARISQVQQAASSMPGVSSSANEIDSNFVEAGKFIIEKDKASIGMLQRVFKIGFNRAARIMDQLSDAGVVGPEEGTKPRKVLMSMEEFEQYVDEYV